MEPSITQKPEIYLVGMSFYGDPFSTRGGWEAENEIGRLWSRLMKYLGENGEMIQYLAQPGVAYEVHIYNEETVTQGIFEVFVGVPVEEIKQGLGLNLMNVRQQQQGTIQHQLFKDVPALLARGMGQGRARINPQNL